MNFVEYQKQRLISVCKQDLNPYREWKILEDMLSFKKTNQDSIKKVNNLLKDRVQYLNDAISGRISVSKRDAFLTSINKDIIKIIEEIV